MKKPIIIIMILVILSTVTVATDFERYALQYYATPDTSYDLRAANLNGLNYNDISACSVGYGTELGTYPIQFSYDGSYYNYLVAPTSSAIRVINSNCTEINTITLSNVNLYGTLSTITESDNTHKYIILGHNTTSG